MSSRRGFLYILLLLHMSLFSKEIYFPKAKVTYNFFQQKKTYYSNDIKLQQETIQPPSIKFFSYSRRGESFEMTKVMYKNHDRFYEAKKPLVRRRPISLKSVKVRSSRYVFNYDAVFIEVKDKSSKDFVDLVVRSKLDTEVIRVYEVQKDSGVFRGYFQPTNRYKVDFDGMLFIKRGDNITLSLGDKATTSIKVASIIRSLSAYNNQDIWLENKTDEKVLGSGDFLKTVVTVKNNSSNPTSATFFIQLDRVFSLVKDTIMIDDKLTSYTKKANTISFVLKLEPNSQKTISYIVKTGITNQQKTANQTVTFAKNTLTITSKLTDELKQNSSIIVGKVSMGSKGVGGIKVYLENGISSTTDKLGRFHFEGIEPDFHVVKVDTSTISERFAIASCKQDIMYAKSLTSRFVDTSSSNIARANFCLRYVGTKSKKSKKQTLLKPKIKTKMPKYSKSSFKEKGNKVLWPPKDFIPTFPSVKLAFMHKSNLKYKVFINSKEVDKLSFDGFEISPQKDFKIEKYRGVAIKGGDNLLEIKLYQGNNLVQTLKQNIHFCTSLEQAELVKQYSVLEASPNKSPIIAIKIYDKDGHPVRRGLKGKCSVSEPYYFARDLKSIKNSPLSLKNHGKYTVEDGGMVYIKLFPTTNSGEVKIHFDFMDAQEYVRAWLKPVQQDWVIVGFAKGSFGYKTIKNNLKKTKENKNFSNGKISFFAKGSISSDTLLSIAYNSAKKVDLTKLENSSLKKSYFIYADDSKQTNEAPSSQKLYIRLDKENFYTLFGDFFTGLNQTKLTRYDTKVNGLKAKYNKGHFNYTAFVTKSSSIHQLDELTPDGTSGRYFIKNKNIIEKTEIIKIITRDKDNYDKIINEETLARDLDYNINYQDGYIFFKEPQFATDENSNKRYIQISYETTSKKLNKDLTYGVHAGFSPSKNISTGISYIKSSKGLEIDELKGIDVMMKAFKNIEIKLETASSKNNKKQAQADYQEIKYHKKNLTVKAYHSIKDKDFGMQNQTNNKDLDSEIHAIKAEYEITKDDTITLVNNKKTTLSTQKSISKIKSLYKHKAKSYQVEAGMVQYKQDGKKDKKRIWSIRKNFFNSKIVAKITKIKSLDQALLAPDETILKVNYLLTPKIKIFTQKRVATLKDKKSSFTKTGLSAVAWEGATVTTSLVKQDTTDSFSQFANYGLLQQFSPTKNLHLTTAFSRQKTLKGKPSIADYDSYSLSAYYHKKKWHSNLKAEYKDTKNDKLYGAVSTYAKLDQDYAVAFGLRGYKIFSEKTSYELEATASVAFRPKKSDTIVVDRVVVKTTKNKKHQKKIINNLYADTKISKDFTLSGQLGIKYIKSKIDDKYYSDLVGLLGANTKYDINEKFAINSQVSMSFSFDDKTYEYSAGSSVGYSPFRDSLICLGYNIKGFNDEDFDSDIYREQGAFVNFLLKFDEFSLNERAKRTVE